MGCNLLPRHAVLVTFRMNADAPNASSEWFSTIYGDPKTSGLGLISSGLGQLPNGSLLYMDIPRQSIFVDLAWLMMLHDPLKYDFDRGRFFHHEFESSWVIQTREYRGTHDSV